MEYTGEKLPYDEYRLYRQHRWREKFGMTEREWTCLRMQMFEGYKQIEVARLLGVTTVSIGAYTDSAQKKLFTKLSEKFDKDGTM